MSALHPDWLERADVRTLVRAFPEGALRFVGGAVRDSLLGIAVNDIDAATTLAPDVVMQSLQKAGIKALPTGIAHGTVTALVGKQAFEITTLRKDTACDGRHATVAFTDDWREDAARRDFTMNALYLSPEGELFDYFGGGEDAKAGRVRFIGDPAARIGEDYLRILRFFRFYAYYGKGAVDAGALGACEALAANIGLLSGERICNEMLKLFAAPAPLASVKLMEAGNILLPVFGFAITSCEALAQLQKIEAIAGITSLAPVRLAALLLKAALVPQQAAAMLAAHWKLSGEMQKTLDLLLANFSRVGEPKTLLRQCGAQNFKQMVLLRWSLEHDAQAVRQNYLSLLQLADSWVIPRFEITGGDLAALGMQQGKAMGDLLRQLESEWEASGYQLSRETLLARAKILAP